MTRYQTLEERQELQRNIRLMGFCLVVAFGLQAVSIGLGHYWRTQVESDIKDLKAKVAALEQGNAQ